MDMIGKVRRAEIAGQLNRSEGRHSLARDVFHGKRGELCSDTGKDRKIS